MFICNKAAYVTPPLLTPLLTPRRGVTGNGNGVRRGKAECSTTLIRPFFYKKIKRTSLNNLKRLCFSAESALFSAEGALFFAENALFSAEIKCKWYKNIQKHTSL